MADSKITALTALTAADPVNDMFPVVDVSDTSMAASGTTKRISVNNILSSSPTASGALTVTGLVTAGSATITGAATVGTTLGVTGVSTLASATITGAATIGTTLGVTGVSSFAAGTALLPSITRTGDTNTGAFFPAADTFAVATGGSERYRVTSDGILIGTSSTSVASGGIVAYGISAAQFAIGHATGSTSGNSYSGFQYAGTEIGSITQSGTTAVLYNTTSDYRLKELVKPISGGLARVNALKPSVYNWKSDGSTGEGFLAHELAEVVPFAVSGEKDALNADGTIKSQGIDMSRIVPILVAAIQELTAEVNALKNA